MKFLILSLGLCLHAFAQSPEGWVWLLNNQNLTNWENPNPSVFKFQKGTLPGDNGEIELAVQTTHTQGSQHYFLILKAQPRNYVLEFEAKTTNGNGGVQFRSAGTSNHFCGPQADIGPNWSGKVWGECANLLADRSSACAALATQGGGLNKWYSHRVEVNERNYKYYLNNIKCSEITNDNFSRTRVPGGIALQKHGGTGTKGANYKNVRIRQVLTAGQTGVEIPGLDYDPRCDEEEYRNGTKQMKDATWNCAALCEDPRYKDIEDALPSAWCPEDTTGGDSTISTVEHFSKSIDFKGNYSSSEIKKLMRESKISLFDVHGNELGDVKSVSKGIYYIQLENSEYRRVLVM